MTDKVNKTEKIEVTDASVLPQLFGSQDKHLRMLEDALHVTITSRGMKIEISGEEPAVDRARSLIKQLLELSARGIPISQTDIVTAIKMSERGSLDFFINLYEEEIGRSYAGKPIRAKNFGQRQYVQAVKNKDVVFGIGPAGT
ncbi:MAG: phosphate starvation-inducible protein PhoH, partial [Trichococcus flocculiformis]